MNKAAGVSNTVIAIRYIRVFPVRESCRSWTASSAIAANQKMSAMYGTTPLAAIQNSFKSLAPPPTLSQLYLYDVYAQAIPHAHPKPLPHLNASVFTVAAPLQSN